MDCFVALGGNFENTMAAFRRTVALLSQTSEIKNLVTSRIYRTKAISNIKQPDYLNAVCRFSYKKSPNELWQKLQQIEKLIGKNPKPKNAPRMIDLDLLFFGKLYLNTKEITLPHPDWANRLFVLAPLSELLSDETFPTAKEVQNIIYRTSSLNEDVIPISGSDPFKEILSCRLRK